MDAIRVEGLVKRYGKFEALRGVDLSVGEGEVFGLVGPNGAGKTTLIKSLVGALKPTDGTVRMMELDPLKDRAALRREIGYMPQEPALYEDLSARDNVAFFAAAHGKVDRKRVEETLALTDLASRARDPVHKFSGGMKRRVSLACALVHEPRMLLLDEPTAAVDPKLRSKLWATFRRIADDGTTIFVSTHLMDEALMCDRVAVLRGGDVIASDTPRGLLERGKTNLVVSRDGSEDEESIGGTPEDLAAALHPYGLAAEVRAVRVEADTLETVVLSIVGEEEK